MRSDGFPGSDALKNGSVSEELDESHLQSQEVARLRAEVKVLQRKEHESAATIEKLQGEIEQLKQQVGHLH